MPLIAPVKFTAHPPSWLENDFEACFLRIIKTMNGSFAACTAETLGQERNS
jgi:hypothetical protein